MNGIAEIRQSHFHSVVQLCELLIYLARGHPLFREGNPVQVKSMGVA